MLRALAKWAAKLVYIFRQEFQAATADLHGGLSANLAAEKRALIEQLTKEADDIEANITKVEAEDAGKQITLKEKYESDCERHGSEKAVKFFRDQAANGRTVADKIRSL